MKKRLLAVLMTGVVLSTALVGCGSKKNEAAANSDKEVTIRFSWWGGDDRHKPTLEAIKKFEEKNPKIKVKPEYAGWDGFTEKTTTQITGNTNADLMQINYDWLSTFSKKGDGFYDLNKLSSNIKLDNYSKDILAYGTVNGKLNGIPISVTGRAPYFNKTTFDKFGVALPKTWEDILKAPEKFTEKGYYPLDLDSYNAWYLSVVYMQQKTGKEFITKDGKLGFSEDEIKQALEFYKSLEDKKVVPTQKERNGDGGNIPLYQNPNWISGKYAGTIEWTSSVGKYEQPLKDKKQTLALADFPMAQGASTSGWYAKPSMLFAIGKNTKYPEQTAKLLNFLLNDPEAAKILGTTRGIPASKAAADELTKAGQLKGLAYEGTVALDKVKAQAISPYFENSKMVTIYKSGVEEVSYGKASAADEAKKMYKSLTDTLAGLTK